MVVKSKGFYFSLDAMMAMMILSAMLGLVFQTYAIENAGPVVNQGSNSMENMLKQPIGDFNDSINYSDKEDSVAVAVRNLYERGEFDKSEKIAGQYIERLDHEAALYLANETDSALIYNTSIMQNTKEVRSQMVYLPYTETAKTQYNTARMVVWD